MKNNRFLEGRVFYINLKHRKDRYDNVQKQMKWWPKNKIIRIDAIKHEDGALGCGLTHIKALKHAKKIDHLENKALNKKSIFKFFK